MIFINEHKWLFMITAQRMKYSLKDSFTNVNESIDGGGSGHIYQANV